jgi:hypothetical protein
MHIAGKRSGATGSGNPLGPVPIDGHNDSIAVVVADLQGRFSVGEDAVASQAAELDGTYRVAVSEYDGKTNRWTVILEEK